LITVHQKYSYKLQDGITEERLGMWIVKNEGIVEIIEGIVNRKIFNMPNLYVIAGCNGAGKNKRQVIPFCPKCLTAMNL